MLPKINKNDKKNPSKTDLFQSKQLYINNLNLTREYIRFIRPINYTYEEELKKKILQKKKKNIIIKYDFKKKNDKLNYKQFLKLCLEEKLIQSNEIKPTKNPLISIIVPAYNKEKVIMKSIRSIQNQSLKNIEIIIVDDCSTDNSTKYYKLLLDKDPRIRIFYHMKNLGVWRTRLDGFLYSKGKYVIHFDAGDIYEDNYVLEDALNYIEKYDLDSIKMFFRIIKNYTDFNKFKLPFKVNISKVIYKPYIESYDKKMTGNFTNVWNRLTRNNILTKGLYLLNSNVLNIYKNLWEDIWWNMMIDKVSYNFTIIKRFSYLYFKDGTGEGTLKAKTKAQKDKIIHEFIYFLYFNLNLLPKKNTKKYIINRLKNYNQAKDISINDFKTKFYILDNLLKLLIKDHFVKIRDKLYAIKLLKESKNRRNKVIMEFLD